MSDMKTAKYLWVKSGQVTTNLAIILKPSAGGHYASEIGEFSVYYAIFSGWRSVAYMCMTIFLFRGGASFKILSYIISKDFMKKSLKFLVHFFFKQHKELKVKLFLNQKYHPDQYLRSCRSCGLCSCGCLGLKHSI